MGRTLGPFTDVSTARVDGAYEIYRGSDDDGREVEILTLGSSSSKDPARRALLSDTVAWAHATRGPADASILSADLDSEQPYVVTLRQDGMRGVERMLERMLAMGPSAGPLTGPRSNSGQFPIVGPPTGHIPVITGHTDPHGIPRVVSTPPSGSPVAPASPMASYVTKAQSSRPSWLIPVISGVLLLVLAAGGLFVVYGMSGDESGDNAADSQQSQPDQGEPPEETKPTWDDDLTITQVLGTDSYPVGTGEVVALSGWPFAFKVGEGMTCEQREQLVARCTDAEDSDRTVRIEVQECGTGCGDDSMNELVNAVDLPGKAQRVNNYTQTGSTWDGEVYLGGMTRFYLTDSQQWLFVTVEVADPDEVEARRIVNSVATQTPTPDD